MRIAVRAAILAAVMSPLPLAAQARGGGGMDMDHTIQINGSGRLPHGWVLRWDSGNPPLTAIEMQQRGGSFRFRSGPAAIYYNPKFTARGEFTVSAAFSQTRSMGHEAYGLFIGGQNLEDSTQQYLYFVIKPCRSTGACSGDAAKSGGALGEILISQRRGNGKPTALVAATHDDAVHPDDPATGAASNVVAIHVAKDSVQFFVNGRNVRTLPRSALGGMSTDGIAGLRVNHNLDIQVDGFAIKR
jgi:hypothetical protein